MKGKRKTRKETTRILAKIIHKIFLFHLVEDMSLLKH